MLRPGYPLETARLALRPFEPGDLDELHAFHSLPEVARFLYEVSLHWLSRRHRQGEIGFVFHPGYQGKGLATEAAEMVLGLGFDGLGLHRMLEDDWRARFKRTHGQGTSGRVGGGRVSGGRPG